jgi:hypothetical protein
VGFESKHVCRCRLRIPSALIRSTKLGILVTQRWFEAAHWLRATAMMFARNPSTAGRGDLGL